MEIIRLEKDFVKKHYEGWSNPVHFIQLEETDNAYLYKREIGSYVDYYVILKKKTRTLEVYHEGDKVIRRYSPYREIFPDSFVYHIGVDERWWFGFETLDRAYKKLSEL